MNKILPFLIILLTVSSSWASSRPNVVILLSDDVGNKDIGCYGGPVKTPTLDKLSAGGIRFTDFYSGATSCSPSRATLLTGRHHIRAGVYSWIHEASQRSHLLEREITLAEILQNAGYATAHFGKWHLGFPSPGRTKPTPDKHGFDYWFATPNNAEPSQRDPKNFIRNGKPVGQLRGYSCHVVVDDVISWLENHRDKSKPFFLNIWFHEPHKPAAAPDQIVAQYHQQYYDEGAVYSGSIANTDRAIARLMEKLAEIDSSDNTLVIYTSDNGSYRQDRIGNLYGTKGSNWEGGIRVPGIFSWPGTIAEGVVLSQPVGGVDILPTVCGLLGIDPPAGVHLDGSDLSPLLTGRAEAFERHQPLFWYHKSAIPVVAMRDGDYSIIANPDYVLPVFNVFQEEWIPFIRKGRYKDFQLFNLREDPMQSHDLSATNPELLNRMKEKLLEINRSIMADAYDWHLHE